MSQLVEILGHLGVPTGGRGVVVVRGRAFPQAHQVVRVAVVDVAEALAGVAPHPLHRPRLADTRVTCVRGGAGAKGVSEGVSEGVSNSDQR